MVVLIYGEHKVSEPLVYTAALEILTRNPHITGVECPVPEYTDWILTFNEYIRRIRTEEFERPISLWEGYNDFSRGIFRSAYEWMEEVKEEYAGQHIFSLHDGFDSKGNSHTKYAHPIVAWVEFGNYKLWDTNSEWIETLAQKFNLRAKLGLTFCETTIEFTLPPDIPKYFAVNEEYIEELEEIINNGQKPDASSGRGIKIHSLRFWEGQFDTPTLWRASPYLVPDEYNPRYGAVLEAVVNFTDNFLKKMDDLDR